MRHDQLFKAVLQNCFDDFLKLFYPDVAERLDFATLRFLEKELFTDFPEGSRREADIVAEVKTHDGDPEIVLVHVEVQARTRGDFARRMFQYYAMLWLRHSIPIFPIVVYVRGGYGLTEEAYRQELFGLEPVRVRGIGGAGPAGVSWTESVRSRALGADEPEESARAAQPPRVDARASAGQWAERGSERLVGRVHRGLLQANGRRGATISAYGVEQGVSKNGRF